MIQISVFSDGFRRPLWKGCLTPKRVTTHRLRAAALESVLTLVEKQWRDCQPSCFSLCTAILGWPFRFWPSSLYVFLSSLNWLTKRHPVLCKPQLCCQWNSVTVAWGSGIIRSLSTRAEENPSSWAPVYFPADMPVWVFRHCLASSFMYILSPSFHKQNWLYW